jgi:threonine synthase
MDYQVPDYCIVGVGDGTVISSLIKGFDEFRQLGLVDKVPIVIGVQAQSASTLKKVFDGGQPYRPIREEVRTIADSISVGYPRDVIKACKFLKKTGGSMIAVSDQEIKRAVADLAAETGVFAEPAGAAPLAGLKGLMDSGRIHPSNSVVLVVTGNGLKDTRAIGGEV